METSLIDFLSQYILLSEEEVQIIKKHNLIQEFKKNTILLKEGQVSTECYLVLKGCIRSYYLLDGEEKTTEFFIENQPVTPVSYIKKIPSEYYLSCMEDCILSIGSPEKTHHFLNEFPKFASLIGTISNDLLANHQMLFDDFKNLPPEKRYLKLIDTRPDLVNRVPQYYLASYLGIKPQSLSRIRKRISWL
ncbi:putative transcriptional regulator, Crp/Fnr family protein [Flammeovirgaceae bacterium 311]|nr:putative transcriptional regulator, Crp/Fnr family protein [Flammeovirgaceae bacterium 311]